jgi:hypothetical protein
MTGNRREIYITQICGLGGRLSREEYRVKDQNLLQNGKIIQAIFLSNKIRIQKSIFVLQELCLNIFQKKLVCNTKIFILQMPGSAGCTMQILG